MIWTAQTSIHRSSNGRTLRSAAALALGLLAAPLVASAALADTVWDHNGSEMLWQANGDTRVISYLNPRSGLPVAPGTVLFEGERDGDVMQGYARIFRDGCEPALYWVSGIVASETHVVLRGAAPVRAEGNSCEVVGYDPRSGNSILVFDYLRQASPGEGQINVLPPENVLDPRPIGPTDEDLGQDPPPEEQGTRTQFFEVPGIGQAIVDIRLGVGSHAMPDLAEVALICADGRRVALQPDTDAYACSYGDARHDLIWSSIYIERMVYDHNTGACVPDEVLFSYAGAC